MSEEREAVRKAGAAYLDAMNRGDLEGVLSFWAPDADYVDDAGRVTRGREALAERFKVGLAETKGTRISNKVRSLKFLRPEVAMEDGTLEFRAPDGSVDTNRYTLVWVKSGDRWLISSVHDVPDDSAEFASPANAQLKQLEWLVGEWRDAGEKLDVTVTCRWDLNRSFLVMQYEVKHPGDESVRVTQRIGWDERNGLLRSWTFDSQGGFGESYWQRDGHRWVARTTGTLPDGGVGTATNVYEFVDQNTFEWRSLDRDVDGQPVADAGIKFVRKAAK